MTDVTRGEIDARFSTAEARTETRFIELRSSIERLAEGLTSVRAEVHGVRAELRDFCDEVSQVKADNKNTRWTIAITVVLAGAGAIWSTQNNLLAAFQAGLARQSWSEAASARTVEPAATAPAHTVAPSVQPSLPVRRR